MYFIEKTEQGMCEKKVACGRILILSSCEFQQFAYSKACLTNMQVGSHGNVSSICYEYKDLGNNFISNEKIPVIYYLDKTFECDCFLIKYNFLFIFDTN